MSGTTATTNHISFIDTTTTSTTTNNDTNDNSTSSCSRANNEIISESLKSVAFGKNEPTATTASTTTNCCNNILQSGPLEMPVIKKSNN